MSFFTKCNTVRYIRKKAQEVLLRLIFTAFLRINSRHFSILKHLVYGGPNGELGASLRYLSQRYTMPDDVTRGLLTDIGTEELGHLEMVGTLVKQLNNGVAPEEWNKLNVFEYYADNGNSVYPQSSQGSPFNAAALAVTGDAITNLFEDLAADAALS
mgnify:CR=1 FL=1